MSSFEVIGANIWLIKISQGRKILRKKKKIVCVCASTVQTFIYLSE